MTVRFDRRELAGALGDLGTLLPLTIAMIQVNHFGPAAVLASLGLFYVLSGAYFRLPTPVQPMKAIAAYAIAQGLSPLEVTTSGAVMGVVLILLAATSAVDLVAMLLPRAVVRGIQLTTGVMLLSKGVHLVAGSSQLQSAQGLAEPFLGIQDVGPVPIGLLLGSGAFVLILILRKNPRLPASLAVLALGSATGLALGAWSHLSNVGLGLELPRLLPWGTPSLSTIIVAATALVLPQLPMTIGNAVLAEADLARDYFGADRARRVTPKALTLSMGLANLGASVLGGFPMCHGSGGLAAHYHFGARTAGANLIIGGAFVLLALGLGDSVGNLLSIVPLSVLGALLMFAGLQLALVIGDVNDRDDLFVAISILGIALASSLAIGVGLGIVLAYLLRRLRQSS